MDERSDTGPSATAAHDAPGLWIVRADDQPRVRWRNGGGWTRELLAWPESEDWALRISVADIESDGPFSIFPRVDRWFAVLRGAGVVLEPQGGDPIVVRVRDEPYAFAGDVPTECRLLAGPTRDFNVMVHRDRARVHIADLRASIAPHDRASWVGCFTEHAGRVRVGDHPWQPLSPLSLAWIAPPAGRMLRFDAIGAPRGWWIELQDTT